MSYLAVPLRDQLTDYTIDGRPSENAADNCVPMSGASIIQYDTGTRISADAMKDAVYGEGWANRGTSEDAFVGIMASYGVRVTRHNGSQADLWATAQAEAAAGRPSIISIPSLWESQPGLPNYTPWAPGFPTHAVVFCGVSNGVGRMMNPWHGVYMDRAVSWFAQRLCWGCIYLTSSIGGSNVGLPAGWSDSGTVLTAPNGITVGTGFRFWVLNHPWEADNWPLAAEASLASIEPGNPAIGGGSRQDFRMSSLGYVGHDVPSASLKAGDVYQIWTGNDIVALRAQVADLTAKLAAAPTVDPVKDAALAAVQAMSHAMGMAR